MKPAFSLLELIFAIVVLGIIVSVAVPKFLDTRDSIDYKKRCKYSYKVTIY